MSSTFQKYGGFGAVSRVVLTFYEMILDSDIVGHHFDNIDMARLMDHQTKFVSALMGGPSAMTDDRLAHVHHAIDISVAEFDEVVRLLSEAMREHGMDDRDIREVTREFEARRGFILRPGVQ
ncbi:group 1 truncated hemoglobin [uncultured Roseobacter sp.]|uniref:group I truncated hemoglobin n=1 Tax=uncultured Roseobacter sp. TaxID=114847 RepID=UPI00262A539E|nr:group 1 truncated hemoglobin [uncultured Roseobacter sp.]